MFEMIKAYLMSMPQSERVELVIILIILAGVVSYLKYQSGKNYRMGGLL